jgi:hypothetical protein
VCFVETVGLDHKTRDGLDWNGLGQKDLIGADLFDGSRAGRLGFSLVQ